MKTQKSVFIGGVFAVLVIFSLIFSACSEPEDPGPSTYIVTFVDGSTELFAVNVESGRTVSRPANDPIKEGHTFDNWYSNSELNILFSFGTPINRNTTVYAKFNINTYTVTFNLDGGPPPPAPQNIAYGGTVTQPFILDDPGYTLSGWYREPTLTGAWNFNTDTVTGNTVLYARFSLNTYTVTFMDGGTVLSVLTQTNVAYGDRVNSPTENPIKQGYTLDNWYEDSGLTTPFSFNTQITSNIIIYGKFNIDTYTVTFYADGGTPAPVPQYITYGGTVTQPSAMTRTGYTFSGWYRDPDLTSTWYFNTNTVTGNTAIYAKWTINTYTVTFYADGGTPAPVPQYITYGGTVTQPDTMTKTGYTFGGWYRDPDLTSIWYFYWTTVTDDTPLYAKWTPITYAITYKDVGDEMFSGILGLNYPITHTYGTVTTLVIPTKFGYSFSGWFTNSDGTENALSLLSATNYTTDIILYAKWLPNSITITLEFAQIIDQAPTLDDITIYRTNGPRTATINLRTPGQYTSYEWYYNNIRLSSSSYITLNSSDIRYNMLGTKRLTLEVVKDGIFYSTSISFTVEE